MLPSSRFKDDIYFFYNYVYLYVSFSGVDINISNEGEIFDPKILMMDTTCKINTPHLAPNTLHTLYNYVFVVGCPNSIANQLLRVWFDAILRPGIFFVFVFLRQFNIACYSRLSTLVWVKSSNVIRFSPNWPTGPFWSSSRKVCVCVYVSLSHAMLPGELSRLQGSK